METLKLTLVWLLVLHRCYCSKKETVTKAATQLLEKEEKILGKLECRSTAEPEIAKLRLQGKTEKAITCLIKALKGKPDESWNWSQLGQLYLKNADKGKASICFKQAAKLNGKLSSNFITKWHVIAPFLTGKPELDGDPVEAFGGIREISKDRYNKKAFLFSEVMKDGKVYWKTFEQQSHNSQVQITPAVQWGDLVNSLGSLAIMEWQGWAVGELAVNDKEVEVLCQCLGVPAVFVDDVILPADVYRRDQFWFPLTLSQGIHTVYIRLRAKGPQVLSCRFELRETPFHVHAVQHSPDLLDGMLFSSVVSVPVTNLQSSKWLKNIRIRLPSEENDQAFVVKTASKFAYNIAPGQTMPVYFQLEQIKKESHSQECSDKLVQLTLSTSAGSEDFSVKLRCRRRHESFLFTFVDHDGSIQTAAAVKPLEDCPHNVCPVLLTLHGTGVAAQNQADGYKRMENDEWIFGLENAWVLAATRHGAHNWEGPGALTAMTALEQLQELTADWLQNKASSVHVIFAGHSMGGHGSWHLATHFPDRALAVISLAGWIKKEEYGDSNEFFRFDISTSHTDPAVKALMEACIAENDADRHVSNLKGVPVLARIGADDRTVHPFFVRRMVRLLKEAGVNVTYRELPGKQHWWWDTWKTNDGGAVNDPELRKFTNSHAVILGLNQERSCNSEGDGCYEGQLGTKKYTERSGKPESFKLTVVNPAFGEGLKGVLVLQQTVPFRISTVQMEFTGNQVKLTTTNVKKLSIKQKSYLNFVWKALRIEIDGENLSDDGEKSLKNTNQVHLCKSDGYWSVCVNDSFESATSRGPANLGPARRVAEYKFLIVTGTLKKDRNKALLQFSTYIANLFYLTSDTIAPITEDQLLTDEVAGQHNLIVIGNEEENAWTSKFIQRVPLNVSEKGITVGSCRFQDSQTGALFLAPHRGSGLALVLIGCSSAGLADVIRLATPTIPPMARSPFSNLIPDYIITGPNTGALGPGGYLCAGFWGNKWDFRPELSSCAC